MFNIFCPACWGAEKAVAEGCEVKSVKIYTVCKPDDDFSRLNLTVLRKINIFDILKVIHDVVSEKIMLKKQNWYTLTKTLNYREFKKNM